MKIRILPLAVLIFLGIFSFAITVMSFKTSHAQVDTLPGKPANNADSIAILEKINVQATKNYQASKDTTNLNLKAIGNLKPKVDQVRTTLSVAQQNLKGLIIEKDVQTIEKVYRIDTSPRPVVIIVNPYVVPTKKPKSWFNRRD